MGTLNLICCYLLNYLQTWIPAQTLRVIITASVRRLDPMMHAVYVWIAAHLTKNPFAHQMAQRMTTDVCLKEKFVYID